MLRRSSLFAALLLPALTMGLEFAHVLEWGTQSQLSRPLYTRLQESLYNWYGNIGGVIYVLAVICMVLLAVLAWRDRTSRGLTVAAAAIEVAALIVFLTVVLPVNSKPPYTVQAPCPLAGRDCVTAGKPGTPPDPSCSPSRSSC